MGEWREYLERYSFVLACALGFGQGYFKTRCHEAFSETNPQKWGQHQAEDLLGYAHIGNASKTGRDTSRGEMEINPSSSGGNETPKADEQQFCVTLSTV